MNKIRYSPKQWALINSGLVGKTVKSITTQIRQGQSRREGKIDYHRGPDSHKSVKLAL